MIEKRFLSWEAYVNLLHIAVASLPLPISQLHYVTGIPRGGLIPAVLLSHHYNLKYLSLDEAWHLGHRRGELLLVDDIADSGATLRAAKEGIMLRDGQGSPLIVTAVARDKFRAPSAVSEPMIPQVWAGKYYGDDEEIWWTFPYERLAAEPVKDGTHVG